MGANILLIKTNEFLTRHRVGRHHPSLDLPLPWVASNSFAGPRS